MLVYKAPYSFGLCMHRLHWDFLQGYCLTCGPSCRQEDKPGALLWLLQEVVQQGSPTLIFTATRHHVEFLHNLLTKEGLKTVCVYGQMDQVATYSPLAAPQLRAVCPYAQGLCASMFLRLDLE